MRSQQLWQTIYRVFSNSAETFSAIQAIFMKGGKSFRADLVRRFLNQRVVIYFAFRIKEN